MLNSVTTTFYYYSVFNGTFYLVGFIFYIIDTFQMFSNNKIQEKSPEQIKGYYKKCLFTVLFNTFIATIPGIFLVAFLGNWAALEFSFSKAFFDLLITLILTDIFFYTIHRALHHPKLYRFHKKHHEITAPIGISAIYASLTDLYLGNILPIYLPVIIISAHPIIVILWTVIITTSTVTISHSGFKGISEFHDYHHAAFNKNYGTNLFMDKLFGTLWSKDRIQRSPSSITF